jgi:transposase
MIKSERTEKIHLEMARQIRSLERRLTQMETSLAQRDKQNARLLKKIDILETECRRLGQRVRELNGQNRELRKQLKDAEAELESANKQLAWFRKDKFGDKSEIRAGADDDEKPGESSDADVDTADEQQVETKRKRGQQPGSKGHGRSKPAELSLEEIELDLLNCCCPDCSKPYTLLPGTDDSTITDLESNLHQSKYSRKRYATNCNCRGRKIITAAAPQRLYPKTTIGNNLWVHLCVWKFLHGVPTNRMLKDFSLRGFPLAAGTVTGGFRKIDAMITSLYTAIQNHCRGESFWNADETGWRVFSDHNGEPNRKKWWLWVIAGYEAIVYILDQSRGSKVPNVFLAGSCGVIMTDRCSAYKSLPVAIRNAWCWVHVRRDFLAIYDGMPKYKAWAKDWLLEFSKLFSLHHQASKLSKTSAGLSKAWLTAWDALKIHTHSMREKWITQKPIVKSDEQKKVLKSFKTHWDGLTIFLSDIHVPLDNNRAERLLRPCVISRKNSYGSGVEWTGQMGVKLFSLFQTWLANGLDPQALLLDYFNECSLTPGIPPPVIDKFLPWNMTEQRKLDFQLPDSYKRPG